jgi:uncharacterized protein
MQTAPHSGMEWNLSKTRSLPFQVMIKPTGSLCNLACKYCFYSDKKSLYPDARLSKMSDAVSESFIKQYIESQNTSKITFSWQGGEPTLLGVDFFRRIVELQQRYAFGKQIANTFQTNGTLLNAEWCNFLSKSRFLVGISIDGDSAVHDVYRRDKSGKPSFSKVLRAIKLLREYDVEFNTLTVVSSSNEKHPLEVYNFLKENGSHFMQFIPAVERSTPDGFAQPPDLRTMKDADAPVHPASVHAETWGTFLCTIFDEWIKKDVGRFFIQYFDTMLGIWMGQPSSLCVFAPTCGRALALEYNGDLYSCDHFVYPDFKLGNITETPMEDLIDAGQQESFGSAKGSSLPRQCRECEYLFACNGGCPKYRFVKASDGESGLNYLCAGLNHFFAHIDPAMKTMAALVKSGHPADEIIPTKPNNRTLPHSQPGRNDPCPCGSGNKFKKCHGAQ